MSASGEGFLGKAYSRTMQVGDEFRGPVEYHGHRGKDRHFVGPGRCLPEMMRLFDVYAESIGSPQENVVLEGSTK